MSRTMNLFIDDMITGCFIDTYGHVIVTRSWRRFMIIYTYVEIQIRCTMIKSTKIFDFMTPEVGGVWFQGGAEMVI